MYKLILLIAAVSFSVINTLYAQSVTVTESFDAVQYAPTGWSIKPDMGTQNVWVRRTTGTNGNVNVCATHSGAGLSRFTSRVAPAGTKQLLVSKLVDYSNRGTNAATLDLWMFRDSFLMGNPDTLTIWINTTDTLTASAVRLGVIARNRSINLPDTQAVNGWYNYSYNIPSTFNTGTNYFIFEGTSESATTGQGANIFIDDITYNEYPPLCTGTPNVGNVTSPSALICGGSGQLNLSLTASPTSTNGVSYVWEESASASGPWTSFGANAATTATNTLSATTYVRCTATCSFSSLSYTTPVYTITVSTNPLPVLTLSPQPAIVCAGDSLTLYATGADSFAWSPIVTSLASTNDSVKVAPATPTQYIVTGIDATGCTASATINVQPNNGPNVVMTATPGTIVCKGQQVILNCINGPANGLTFAWSDGKTTRRDTIIVNTDQTLTVVVTNQAGCSRTDSISIAIDTTVKVDFGYTHNGFTFDFADSTTGSTSWTWAFGDGNSSTSQNPTYTYSAPGDYTVTLTVDGGPCGQTTITKIVSIWPESVYDLNVKGFAVYPNPVKQSVYVQLAQVTTQNVVIELYNTMGQKINTYNLNASKVQKIDVATIAKGVYYFKMNGKAVKFIKD